jgi:hypothetical protein
MMINQLGEVGQWKVDQSRDYRRANGVELEAHRGDNAEVPAAAAKAPEQVAVVAFIGRDQMAICSDDCGRLEVVAAKAYFAMQPAETPAEREAGNACHRHDRSRAGEPEGLSHLVKMRPS